jgi:uncharacterized protein
MPVRLRGHHFLCILTFKGEGYSKPFIANLNAQIKAISKGQAIKLKTGPDDICAGLTKKCLTTVSHDCNSKAILQLDQIAINEVSRTLNRDLKIEAPLTPDDIILLRDAFKKGAIRTACTDCSWKKLCDDIANNDFKDTKL